jgi:hypothetical protein
VNDLYANGGGGETGPKQGSESEGGQESFTLGSRFWNFMKGIAFFLLWKGMYQMPRRF